MKILLHCFGKGDHKQIVSRGILFEFIDCNPFFLENFACAWSRDTRAIFLNLLCRNYRWRVQFFIIIFFFWQEFSAIFISRCLPLARFDLFSLNLEFEPNTRRELFSTHIGPFVNCFVGSCGFICQLFHFATIGPMFLRFGYCHWGRFLTLELDVVDIST